MLTKTRSTTFTKNSNTNYKLVSIVLPVRNQEDHIERVVRSHLESLKNLGIDFEIVLVPNGCSDRTEVICQNLAEAEPNIVNAPSQPGWGKAIQEGVTNSHGDLVCFASSARIGTKDLLETVQFALSQPDNVIKGRRAEQDNGLRSIGSLVYNSFCRALFGIATKDVNGGPKCFPQKWTPEFGPVTK